MPVQDFLITFRADTAGAIAEINALAQRVQTVDAALNAAMGQLQRRTTAGGGPLAALTAGAPGAARSIQSINAGFLQMGKNIQLTEEELQDILVRIQQIKTAFSRDVRGGFGASINQGQLKEAIRLVTQLKDAHHITADAARKMANELEAAYAKAARIPESLRNLPVAQQSRVSALMRQEIREAGQLEAARQPMGGVRNIQSHQNALENYIRTVRQLGDYSLVTAADLDKLEAELLQVRAASSLETQRGRNVRTVTSLNERANALRADIGRTAIFGAEPQAELRTMRELESVLQQLADRGEPVQRELAETTQKIQQLTAATALATQRTREFAASQSLRNRADQLQLRAQQPFRNPQGELNNLRALERALAQLEARGDPVQRELDDTRRKIEQLETAAARAKSIDQLLNRRNLLEARLARVRNDRGNDRNIIRDLKEVEEALAFKGAGDPNKLANIRAQFAAMPPILDKSTQSMLAFNAALQRRVLMGEALGMPRQSAATLTKGLDNGIELMRRGFSEGADAVEFFQSRVASLPPTLDRAAQGMLNHGRRVAEGLFIYEALGRAMQAIGDQITLVNNLAREQIRFSAVAGGLGDQGSSGFLLGLQDIAVRTNTPMDQLAAQIDTVAAAMLDAGDATMVAADSQGFLNQAGQFTNITQRDLAAETQNLLGIFNQTGDSVDQFGDRLGRITVAGRNNSTIISGITDVLSEAGRTARTTGFDFDFLASIGGQMVQDLIGTMSGAEIGSMLNTIIGRLTDPEVINRIKELSNGIISFSNADGSLRSTSSILIDIFQSIKDGTISARNAPRILDQIVPPLNPAARSFVATLQRNIPEALEDMGRIMGGTAEDAKALSDALVSGPGERFAASLKDIQGALTGIFTEEIITAGNQFANLLKSVAGLLGSGEAGGGIGGSIASIVVRLTLFAAAIGIVSFAWRNISRILFASRDRMASIADAINRLTIAAGSSVAPVAAAGTAHAAAAGQMTLWGPAGVSAAGGISAFSRAMVGLRGVLAGVMGLAKAFLPIMAAMAAFELPDTFADTMAGLEIQDEVAKRSRIAAISPDLLSRGLSVASQPSSVRGIAEAASNQGFDWISDVEISDNQFSNVVALSEALIILKREGKLTAKAQAELESGILTASGAIKEERTTAHELIASMNVLADTTDSGTGSWSGYTEGAYDAAAGLNELTTAEQRAAEAMRVNMGLSDERAAALVRLTEQLREGKITVDEWAEGQSNAAAASEAAASFVAAYGDQLSLIPGLQERMTRTGQTAAEALMSMLLDNPDTIDESIDVINVMVDIADKNAEVAASVAENPIEFSVETQRLIEGATQAEQIITTLRKTGLEVRQTLMENQIEPQIALDKLRAQAEAALQIYKVMIQASATFHRTQSSAFQAANPEVGQALRARVQNQGGDLEAFERAIAELEAAASGLSSAGGELSALGEALGILRGISGDDPRLSASKQPSQTGIIDIGELPASVISQIVAMATAAQRRVVAAGGVVDTDETTAIFKDAAFQQLIRGVDQRFLTQAIEELTEVERKRLELEQQRLQDITRSMVVQSGPIQSIVSAPILAAGGGVLTGQGFNADPRLGNFTINVPINWSGMDLAQLQRFIMESIAKAWIDASRGG